MMASSMKIERFQYIKLKILATLLRGATESVFYFQNRQDLPEPQDERRQKIQIPSRNPGRHIEGFLYYPPQTPERSFSELCRVPVLVNWHSSGFVVPSLGTDRAFCAFIARTANIFILDVDYRKSPEFPFPAAFHDMEDVMSWLSVNQESFDISRIMVSGFSAGGSLALEASALVEMAKARRDKNHTDAAARALSEVIVQAVIAVYPVTDLSIDPEIKESPCPINPVSPSMQNFFWNCYAPNPATRNDPRISPAYIEPVCFPPNIAFVTCDGDTFHSEAADLAQKLDDGTRVVETYTMQGVGHGFDKGAKEGSHEFQQRQKMHDLIAGFIKRVIGKEAISHQ